MRQNILYYCLRMWLVYRFEWLTGLVVFCMSGLRSVTQVTWSSEPRSDFFKIKALQFSLIGITAIKQTLHIYSEDNLPDWQTYRQRKKLPHYILCASERNISGTWDWLHYPDQTITKLQVFLHSPGNWAVCAAIVNDGHVMFPHVPLSVRLEFISSWTRYSNMFDLTQQLRDWYESYKLLFR